MEGTENPRRISLLCLRIQGDGTERDGVEGGRETRCRTKNEMQNKDRNARIHAAPEIELRGWTDVRDENRVLRSPG